MYDLHAHILPGVDDGAVTPEDTLAMSRVAADTGTKVVLATPHRKDVTEESSVAHIRALIADMDAQNRAHGVELSLVLGMENHLDSDLPAEIEAGRALTMNGTRYILIEMPFFGRPDFIEDTLSEVQSMGLVPVLAHPERIEAFQDDPDMLKRFIDRGMVSQITSNSLIGFWGNEVRDFTRCLLSNGMAHIMASDTHHAVGGRSPRMDVGLEAAAELIGYDAALAMLVDTPRAILEDKPIDIESPRATALFGAPPSPRTQGSYRA